MQILCYQSTPHSGDIQQNLHTVAVKAKAAGLLDVDVLVFPELFVTGYNIGDETLTLAQSLDGEAIKQLQQIAQENAVAIVIGFPERVEQQVFNSAVAINSQGEIVGHHRKVFLFGDKEKALFAVGDGFGVFELNGYQCGISICYDIEFPEVIRNLAQQGAKIIFNPTANMQPYTAVPKTLIRARALENDVVVVYANLSGEENGLAYTGLSAIISPEGEDLARAGEQEALLIADVSHYIQKDKQHVFSTQLAELKSVNFKT